MTKRKFTPFKKGDAPRGYKPKPCKGTMQDVDEFVICRVCGEAAHD